jgi:hypothetical protein
MIFNNRWKMGIVVLFGVVILIPVVQAQQPFDITDYFYATVTFLSTDPELAIFHSDVRGVFNDNLESKTFDRMTSHCMRSGKGSTDKMNGITYSKFTDSDGDFFITESIAENIPRSAQERLSNFFTGLESGKVFQAVAKASLSL